MPRIGQIIPEYLVPHVKTYINDNTQFVEEAVEATDPNIRFLYLFASDRGDPYTVKRMSGTTAFIKEYGTPNFEKYGQPNLMPYASLSSGNAVCWCLRVVDENAAHSNMYVVAQSDGATAVAPADGSAPTINVAFAQGKFDNFKLDKTVGDGTLYDNLSTKLDENANALFAIAAANPGKSYDSYRIRIVLDAYSSKVYGYTIYTFEVIEGSTGVANVIESFRVSFDPNSNTANELHYADDVINDPETGSSIIRICTNPAAFKAIYDDYNTFVTKLNEGSTDVVYEIPSFESFDVFTGADSIKGSVSGISYSIAEDGKLADAEILTGGTAVVTFGSTSGLSLANGSDGAFDPDYVVPATGVEGEDGYVAEHTITAEEREAALTKAYIEALDITKKNEPSFFSKRRTPAEFILDANFPCAVKAKLYELAKHRLDAQCVLDAGVKNRTVAEVKTYATTTDTNNGYGLYGEGEYDWIISKECQHYKIRDPFTNKIIPVTYTYYLAQTLPTHFLVYGNHIPFVGERYTALTGQIRNSVVPEIDADDLDTKETLYNLGVNFIETIGENQYIRPIQNTAQSKIKWSDLSEMNNVAVMLDMKRQLENYVSTTLYNFSEAEDRALFTSAANRMFEGYPNNKLRDYSVYFDMNEYETERSILHCYLATTFRQISKRGIIEIDINKRT